MSLCIDLLLKFTVLMTMEYSNDSEVTLAASTNPAKDVCMFVCAIFLYFLCCNI